MTHRPSRRDLLRMAAAMPALTLPALTLPASAARAQLGGPERPNPSHFSFTLGAARLTVVSDVAEHVAHAATSKNDVALGATLSRLERAFDAAVSNVWDYQKFQQLYIIRSGICRATI